MASTAYDCLIEPRTVVSLSSPVGGQLREVRVDRGDVVQRGQVVAVLESGVQRASHELAVARDGFEERRLDRTRALHQRQVVSEQDLDDARESRRLAALEAERSAAAVEQRMIRSPIDGVVVRRLREPGEFTDPPEVLELAQVDPLRVETFLPAHLFGRIGPDTPARVTPELEGGASVAATVQVVDPVIDAASGTFGVRLELPNADRAVAPGLRCHVAFQIERDVPASSD